jgi:hypothetical protein
MNQLMFQFNDKDIVFLYILNEIVDKIPAYKNKQSGNIPEKCEMATTFQTFLKVSNVPELSKMKVRIELRQISSKNGPRKEIQRSLIQKNLQMRLV